MTAPEGPGSVALNTFHPAACALRSGLSLFASASFTFPSTISKSAVLSAFTKFRITPASPGKTKGLGAAAAGCAGAAAGGVCANTAVADNRLAASPRAIERTIWPPLCGLRKGRYFSVLGATRKPPLLREQSACPHGSAGGRRLRDAGNRHRRTTAARRRTEPRRRRRSVCLWHSGRFRRPAAGR